MPQFHGNKLTMNQLFATLMRKTLSILLMGALFASVIALPAMADDWHGHDDHRDHDDHYDHHEGFPEGGDWHWHGDIYHFRDYDFVYWRGGHWFNGPHEGRAGWWWVVNGAWYFYPAPVYPYPDPYVPPGVAVVQGATTPYYHCSSPEGYYPYIAQCAVLWQAVVTTAAPAVVVQQQPTAPVLVANQRDIDYQQLNAYSAELSHIDVNNPPHALVQLKILSKRVSSFRRVVAKRSYNPIDIMKNIDDLKARIAAQKAAYAHPVVVAPGPVPASSLPPGSTVTFPPQ